MNRSITELNLIVRSLERRVAALEEQTGCGVNWSSNRSAIYCEHANEMPARCPCDDDCYCKQHSCKKHSRKKKPRSMPSNEQLLKWAKSFPPPAEWYNDDTDPFEDGGDDE